MLASSQRVIEESVRRGGISVRFHSEGDGTFKLVQFEEIFKETGTIHTVWGQEKGGLHWAKLLRGTFLGGTEQPELTSQRESEE